MSVSKLLSTVKGTAGLCVASSSIAGFDEIHLAPLITSPSGANSIVSIFISVHCVRQCLGSKIGRTMIIRALISLRSCSMTVCYHISQKNTFG